MAGRPKTRAAKELANSLVDSMDYEHHMGKIFDAIANGYAVEKELATAPHVVVGDGLYNYCRDHGIHYLTLLNRITETPELMAQFNNAKRARGQRLVDEALNIADLPVEDMVQVVDKKTRIDTRLKIAKAEYSEAYGEKVQIETVNIEINKLVDLKARKQIAEQFVEAEYTVVGVTNG